MHKRTPLVLSAAVVGFLCLPSGVWAANRFFIPNGTLGLGTTGNTVSVMADLDQPIYGCSVHITFDAAKIRVTGVANGSAITGLSPEYSDGTITNSPGRVVWGVVFDLSNPITKNLAAGTNKELLKLTVDVLASASTTVLLDLVNTPGNPSRLNVMTNANGDSVAPAPTLVDGTLTLSAPPLPIIDSFLNNSGTAGKKFLVIGQNFNTGGLSVKVCNATAAFTLLADGGTIDVTAPACASTGCAEVKVTTNAGSDSDACGFTYDAGPQPPVIDAILDGSGAAGKVFLVIGQSFDTGGLSVKVCNATAAFTLLADGGTIQVTAPACGATGCAEVKVSTNAGSDSEPCGFTYQQVGRPFVRGNSNNDSTVDLSDAVHTLNWLFSGGPAPICQDAADANDTGKIDLSDPIWTLSFLFQGGSPIPPPYPNPGLDPTADALPDC